MSLPTFWIVLFPDLDFPSGGVLQLHRFAEILCSLRCKVHIVQENSDFHPSWFTSSTPTISSAEWNFGEHLEPNLDVIVLPETYVHLIHKFKPSIRKIIFNQNTSYTFGLPASNGIYKPYKILDYYCHPDVIAVCCVSHYDRQVLINAYGLPSEKVFIITNAVDFEPYIDSIRFNKRIVVLPRKNVRDSHIVCSLLSRQDCFDGWSYVFLKNKPHADVLSTLSSSALFLSLGHPEGFGLPVAESLCCECSVIGYSGLGGRELFS